MVATPTNIREVPTDAQIAALLGKDNRTAVITPDPTTPGNVIVASALVGKDGDTFGIGPAADDLTDATNGYDVGPPYVAAYDSVSAADGQVAEIQTEGPLTKANLRTAYFYVNPGQAGGGRGGMAALGARKQCFVNVHGAPLDTDGVPTTAAAAVDAASATLRAQGQAVTNWAQVNKTGGGRSAPPGIYGVDVRQTALYAPYLGWTAQHTPRAFVIPPPA